MSQITRASITAVFIALLALLAVGCGDSNNNFNPDTGKHIAGWDSPDAHGAGAKSSTGGFTSCQDCHGEDLGGGISATSCYTCHGVNAPHPAAPWRGTRTHATTDESNAEACAVCHEGGANSSVQPVPPAPPGTPPGCFNATLCHATPGHPLGWNNPDQHGTTAKSQTTTGFSYCQSCHGTDFAGSGAAVTCLDNTAGCHVGTSGFPYGPSPHAAAPWRASAGSARTHTDTDETNADVCFQCHVDGMYSANTHSSSARLPDSAPSCYNNWLCHATPNPHVSNPTWANATDHGLAAKSAPTSTQGFGYCQSCHGVDFAGGTTTTTCLNNCHLDNASNPVNAPHGAPWTSTSTYKHSTSDEGNAMVCGLCHLDELTNGVGSRTYQPLPGGTTINGCYDGRLCHTASSFGCVDCHASVQTGTHGTPRDAVVGEFGLAWGHKKSGRAAVADDDCVVCHLEGSYTAGVGSQIQQTAYHKDGNIDLRDPDGAGETPITNNSGGAFTFTKYSVSYASGARATSLGNTVAEVVTVKFCIACHDGNGATNPTARSNNGGTGTQYMPFGGVNLGANYTTTNGAAAAGGLIDVAGQFLSTNSSRHPVGAPNSRMYPYSDRLAVPYNNIGTARDANTQVINTASPRVAANSVVLVCDDCHTSGTGLTNRTITSHGSGTGLRGTYFVSAPTLCLTCHVAGSGGPYNGVSGTLTPGNHGVGSGFGVGTTRPANAMNMCNFCHFSNPNVYSAANRPRYAQDIHGFNEIYGTGAGWTVGTANGMRPIAFMRNAYIAGATLQGSWAQNFSPRPYTATLAGPGQFDLAAGNSQCGGSFAFNAGNSGVTGCSSNGHTTYRPGGSY